MYRLAWIIVGCVTAYIASGYIAGVKTAMIPMQRKYKMQKEGLYNDYRSSLPTPYLYPNSSI
jgi:hypothetical protein